MMLRMLFATMLAAAALAAGPSQPDLALSSDNDIQGRWTMVNYMGNPHPPGYDWVIDASKIHIIFNGKETLTYDYILDDSGSHLKASRPRRPTYTWKVKVAGDRLLVDMGQLYDFRRVR